MKTALGPSPTSDPPSFNEGYSVWIESGVWYTAPTVDSSKFGGHDYDNGGYMKGVRDCDCGCFMVASSAGGPVDPFGPCPANLKDGQSMPKPLQLSESEIQDLIIHYRDKFKRVRELAEEDPSDLWWTSKHKRKAEKFKAKIDRYKAILSSGNHLPDTSNRN
jgi:hypothetical protein